MQLRDLLTILRARWLTIAVSALTVLAATAVATLAITPVYTASSRVFFSATIPGSGTGEERTDGGVIPVAGSDLVTYAELIGTPVVLEPLAEAVGRSASEFTVTATPPTDAAKFMDFTATSHDPDLAAEVVNTVGDVLASVSAEYSSMFTANNQIVTANPIAPASSPRAPSSPDVDRNLILGLLAGLVLGVGIALVRHGLDTKVRGEDDITPLSDRPVLAKVRYERTASDQPLFFAGDPHGPRAEALRRLRANLLFVDVESESHAFVVTSSIPGEGKTTMSVNLGLAIADAGSRVLLVDADLRNPSVARMTGLEGAAGLTSVLVGNATVGDVVQRFMDTELYVLPAGQRPPNPSELLGSRRMADLFTTLRRDYDFILIDSPPIIPVVDGLLLAKLTGGAIVVVGVDKVGKRDLAAALKSLKTADARVAGFALNMVESAQQDSYYAYHRYGEPGSPAARPSRAEPPRRATTATRRARVRR